MSAGPGRRPRLGFLGLGWIGRMRLEALARADVAEIVGLADPDPRALREASRHAPDAACGEDLKALLALEPDGVVIATPSALHADQALEALATGAAAFVEKPLGRSREECRAIVSAAARADRLLAIDWSYRHLAGMPKLRAAREQGELGVVFAADLVFHNAYGPDKPWFYDRARSGGGCLTDLGSHLIDLGLWLLGSPRTQLVASRLHAGGRRVPAGSARVEDHALVLLETEDGTTARVACSWGLPAGCDAVFEASLYGTAGGASVRNVDGSFYDFTVDLHHGTRCERLASPPDDWGARALVRFARSLAADGGFDPEVLDVLEVARLLDEVYGR